MAVTNTANFNVVGNVSFGNGDYGLLFTANNSVNVTQVNVTASTAATKARIVRASDNALLGTATFSGTTATFSGSGVAITASTNYYVYVNAEGSSFNADYGNTASDLPSNNTDINFLAAGVSSNAVFITPYNATPATPTFNGGNQIGITSVITDVSATRKNKLTTLGVG